MKLVQRIYYVLIFTNLLIAGAASAQAIVSYFILQKPINWYIITIEGMATLLLYNFSLLLAKPQNPQESAYSRTRWVFKHEKFLWLNTLMAALICTYCVFQIHLYSFLFLGFIGLISVLYSVPLFYRNGKWGGLRQIPALKIFHIAFVWMLSSVFLPYIDLISSGEKVDFHVVGYLAILKFIFLLICTLPFDIRDIKQDSYYHLQTLPRILGEIRAKRLCYLLLSIHSLFLVLAPYTSVVIIGLLITNLAIMLLLRFIVFKQGSNYHHAYLLDLSLILQFVFIYICQQIF